MEQKWPYKRTIQFDFWKNYQLYQKGKRKAESKQRRKLNQNDKRLVETLKYSWWAADWWLVNFFDPLSKRYGPEFILKQDLATIFSLKDAVSHIGEIEDYHSWKYEKDAPLREKLKKHDFISDEEFKKKHFNSANAYSAFLNSRGTTHEISK